MIFICTLIKKCKRMRHIQFITLFSLVALLRPFNICAQEKSKIVDTLTYETQAGLPVAASKIYFSDSKFTISGFGETSYINYLGPKDTRSQDVELYNTNLQRFVAYAAYKPMNWMVLYAEIFAELANDGNREWHLEYLPEVFVDFLISDYYNVRIGTHQVQTGYINNNDEPILFYSVNRPEVERIIIPSQWIDLGIMNYGNLTEHLKWTFSFYQGLDPLALNGGTWLRGGRENVLRFNFNSLIVNPSLTYTGLKDTELGFNGVWTRLGDNASIIRDGQQVKANSHTYLMSSYWRYTLGNWTFMTLGSLGYIQDTENLHALIEQRTEREGQVLGENVYGYYAEVGYDILPLIRGRRSKDIKSKAKSRLYNPKEVKLPVFVRYERLNTHRTISPELVDEDIFLSDLTAITVGLNFNPKRSIVIKANYQFRINSALLPSGETEGDRFELGMGFIF